MPNVTWNVDQWNADQSWSHHGEEWSEPWGGSEAQWFGSLYPRLRAFLPARNVLEIAPGHGRWTRYLLGMSDDYIGVDLNPSCIEICQRRFGGVGAARFAVNDGYSLSAVGDGTQDFTFSFDSLVHAEIDVLEAYIPEIMRILRPGGVAFIHHSNLAEGSVSHGEHDHSRARSVGATGVADIIAIAGGTPIIQEVINWRGAGLIDCLTTFRRGGGEAGPVLTNDHFNTEAEIIRRFHSPYHMLTAR